MPFVLVTLALARAGPTRAPAQPDAPVDVVGAVLCALGLAGPVLALIAQPLRGWATRSVFGAGIVGIALLGAFVLVGGARAASDARRSDLFRRRNFAVGNC